MADLTRRFLYRAIIVSIISGILIIPGLMPGSIARAATPDIIEQESEDFPVYGVIKANKAFWIDIFSKYSRGQGVIHDDRDLSKIYGVIPLDTANTQRAAKKNKKKKKKEIQTYKNILLNLSKGRAPVTAREKRVAAMFGKTPGTKAFKQAAHNLRIQTGLKEQTREGIIRSGALVPEFKRIFRSYGLPEDLVYLPCVESSFNVHAYSKFGAAGIWQFTRGTGKLYMKIGYVVDERRDPFIATHSAAKLLKRNYGALGQWPLAITAYNHGLNGMKRAKKQKGSFDKIYGSYRSRSFKFASRNFYSEFLAAREITKHYTKYFKDLTLARPVSYTRFTTQGFVPAQSLARKLSLDIDELKRLNPALRRPVFDGRKYIPKGFELRLPKEISRKTMTQATTDLYREKQKPSKFHRVKKGDTAGSISRTHGVKLNDLILANGLGRRATIYIGQTLRIPSKGETAPKKTSLALTAPDASMKTKPPLKPKTSLVKTKPIKPEPAKDKQKIAPIPPVEASIKPVKPNAKALPKKAAPEEPRPEKSQPGQTPALDPQTLAAQILAPPPLAAASPRAGAMNLRTVTSDLKIKKTFKNKKQPLGIIHVAAEETLGHYADWLGIPTQRIRTLNRLAYGKAISVGQTIKLPLPSSGSDPFEEQRYEFHQEILEDFFDSFFVAGVDTYEIKSGDTIWSLCLNELEIPLWLLQKYNPAMDFKALKSGDRLIYPLISPKLPSLDMDFGR